MIKDEYLENNIVSLHGRGWSMRSLAKNFGISRQRVKRILQSNIVQRNKGLGTPNKPSKRRSKLDPYKPLIGELLEQYKDPPITNQRIMEHIEEKGYGGGITILRNYLVSMRGKKVKDPIVLVETNPGQRASHDWSDYIIRFTDAEQGKHKVILFSYILNYSRRQYIEVVEDKTQGTLMRTLINAFLYFDGVPEEIKSDNQKAVVDKWELGRPLFNKKFLNFATHYRFGPLTIRPGKPRENLKVERPFYYLETNFLNGRTFKNRQDLKQQLTRWLTQRNDQRIHRTTKRRPIDLYEEEIPRLQALPAKHYDTSIIEYRIVNNESTIQWENYYYVVPDQYMYETCAVRISEKEVIIYSPDCKEIIRHPRAEKGKKNRYVGRREKTKKHPLDMTQVVQRLNCFGPIMQQYIEQLKSHKTRTYRQHYRQILALKANYRPEDIIRAVKRANRYRVYNSKAIKNFLSVNAEKRSEPPFPTTPESK